MPNDSNWYQINGWETCPKCGALYSPYSIHQCQNWYPWGSLYVPGITAMGEAIACEPFKTDAVVIENRGKGFATAKQKVTLEPVLVIFGNKEIPSGATVYVRGDFAMERDGRQVYEVEGRQVIFVPIKEVRLMKPYVYTPPAGGGVTLTAPGMKITVSGGSGDSGSAP